MQLTDLVGVTHDLRSPLANVVGLAQALRSEVYGPLELRQEAALSALETSGRHVLAMIEDIAILARLDAGTLEGPEEEDDLSRLCHASAARASTLGGSARLSLPRSRIVLRGPLGLWTEVVARLLTSALPGPRARPVLSVRATPGGRAVTFQLTLDKDATRAATWSTTGGAPCSAQALRRLVVERLAAHLGGVLRSGPSGLALRLPNAPASARPAVPRGRRTVATSFAR